jgi:hypothetical protein
MGINLLDLARELAAVDALDQANEWLLRGDGVAVYEARDNLHEDFGSRKYVSFGSSSAQLETNEPPAQLPNIGNQDNSSYRLVGFHRGDELAVESDRRRAEGLDFGLGLLPFLASLHHSVKDLF